MQKEGTTLHCRLIIELASLRKGRGLVPAKIAQSVVLRDIVARSSDIDRSGVTDSQVHSMILTEISKLPKTTAFTALRFAFALAEEVKTVDTLLHRRRILAGILGKHVDTIIRYENQAINDFALILEELKATVSAESRATIMAIERYNAQVGIMRDTATRNLAGLLPVANRASELVGYLEQSQRPYLEMNIDLRLLPCSRGKDWYRFETRYTFMGQRDTFRLAVVVKSEDGEQLMAAGLVDEFHKLNDQFDPTREIRSIINNNRFIAHDNKVNSRKQFRLRELEPARVNGLLRSVGRPLKAQCRFLEVTIPSRWKRDDITYEYRSVINLRDDMHYAYWYAPSMMYVRKLIFDYSQFPRANNWNFSLMPFLGNVVGESARNEYSFTAYPNTWIMPGHGIALMWEAK